MDQSIVNRNTEFKKDNYQEKLAKMWKNLSDTIKEYYPSNTNMIPSLSALAKKYQINKNTVRKYILINLEKEESQDSAYKIYTEIWNRKLNKTQERYSKFLKLIEGQFKSYYHRNLEKILGINAIQKEIGASKITIIEWCKLYLKNKFGEKQLNPLYEKIWGSNFALKHKYEYDLIKKFMNNQKGYLLTTKEEWRRMEEVPSERYIKVGHLANNIHHRWTVKVRYLINQSRWCPECNDFFCQKILQMYLNKIFGVNFKPITLKKAFGLNINDGGLLKYDSFNENVEIEGFIFKVAAEYDGEQHDIFPNNYHNSIEEYLIQKRRDSLKDNISNQNLTVLIRIKAVKGFHRKTINCFQEEIIKQLNTHPLVKKANVNIKNVPKYVYNSFLKKLELKRESLEDYLH